MLPSEFELKNQKAEKYIFLQQWYFANILCTSLINLEEKGKKKMSPQLLLSIFFSATSAMLFPFHFFPSFIFPPLQAEACSVRTCLGFKLIYIRTTNCWCGLKVYFCSCLRTVMFLNFGFLMLNSHFPHHCAEMIGARSPAWSTRWQEGAGQRTGAEQTPCI